MSYANEVAETLIDLLQQCVMLTGNPYAGCSAMGLARAGSYLYP